MKLFLLALVPAALRATPIAAQLGIVQPWTYRSPSGAIELFVDPSDRGGEGSASYRMSRDGEPVWTRILPYTLVDVLVLDDGTAGGFAYAGGAWWGTELIVAVLDPDGGERWVVRESRGDRMPCSFPDLTVRELQGCTEGFALDVGGRRSRRWLTFEWSTGKPMEKRVPLPAASAAPSQTEEGPPSPSIELPLLGHVDFPWPPLPEAGSDPRSQAERRGHGPHRVFVDELGRFWLSELSTSVVHVFDAKGLPSVVLVSDPKTFRPYHPVEWMSLRGDGHLFVCADRGVGEFDPSGRQVGRTLVKDSPPKWLFLPGTKSRWSIEGVGQIDLFDGDGHSVRTLARGASGRWFQDFYEASVAPDGGLAVLDEPNPGISSRDPSTWVQLIAPTGEPRRSLRVPAEFCGYPLHVAYDGHRIALLHGRLLLLLNEDGSPIGRTTFSEDLGEPYYLFFSPDGRELWVFPHMRHEMFRFALP